MWINSNSMWEIFLQRHILSTTEDGPTTTRYIGM
jgi:hypothetical protein